MLMVIFYLAYNEFSSGSSVANRLLLLILAFGLVITHHFTSFIAAVYLLVFSALTLIASYLASKRQYLTSPGAKPFGLFFSCGAIAMAFIFIWWNNFATYIWSPFASYIWTFVETLEMAALQTPEWGTGSYPEVLTPDWAIWLLIIRDMFLFLPLIIGFIFIWLRKADIRPKLFIAFSLLVAGLLSVMTFAMSRTFERQLYLFLPFIMLCIAMFYVELRNRWQYFANSLIIITVVLFVFCAFVGGGAHRFIPAHHYDPSITSTEVGEHSANWERLQPFLNKYVTYDQVEQFITDDVHPLMLLLPLEQWDKIWYMENKKAELAEDTLIVAFNKFNKAYTRQANFGEYDEEFDQTAFEEEVKQRYNLLYTDGEFGIWH